MNGLPLRSLTLDADAPFMMHLSMLAPTSPHPGQGGEFSLFGMADLPQVSGY